MQTIDEQKLVINQFYFEEFLKDLPPALQELATNSLVLFHRDIENPIREITQLVRLEYWLTPWFLSDIFELDDEAMLTINKGFLLILLSYLVLDNLVDRQTPDSPLIPLLTQQFYFAAAKEFAKLFKQEDAFWQVYYTALKSHADALSIEYESVVQFNPPFSYHRMREVAIGKAMPFRIAVEALGRLSKQESLISPVSQAYLLNMFADQFYDDADDYLDDWQIKRATLAHVYLAEAEGLSLNQVFELNADTFRTKTLEHQVRQRMIQQSSQALNEAIALFPDRLQSSRFVGLLRERLLRDKGKIKALQQIAFIQRLKNNIKPSV